MMSIRRAHWIAPLLAIGLVGVTGCDDDDDDPIAPTTGSIEVTVTATGEPADPDGFSVMLDGVEVAGGAIDPTGDVVTIDDLDPDTYSLELGGVAANCTVTEANPRDVSVAAGEVLEETFTVTCAATNGALAITSVTAGTNPDADGYMISVGGGAPQALLANGTLDVPGLAVGPTSIELTGVAPNCTVQGGNPQEVNVTAGAPTALTLTIDCLADAGSATVTTVTTGTNPDADGYTVTVDGGATPLDIDANGTLTITGLSAGDHDFTLGGVAANCTVTGSADQTATVTDQADVAVDYEVTCI